MKKVIKLSDWFLWFGFWSTVTCTVGLILKPAYAHDHEHPELTPWYQSLNSGKGPCCDGADAKHLADPDVQAPGQGDNNTPQYRVRIDGQWTKVPDEAIVKGPNRDGRPLVWHYYTDGHPTVRCFMPGAEG